MLNHEGFSTSPPPFHEICFNTYEALEIQKKLDPTELNALAQECLQTKGREHFLMALYTCHILQISTARALPAFVPENYKPLLDELTDDENDLLEQMILNYQRLCHAITQYFFNPQSAEFPSNSSYFNCALTGDPNTDFIIKIMTAIEVVKTKERIINDPTIPARWNIKYNDQSKPVNDIEPFVGVEMYKIIWPPKPHMFDDKDANKKDWTQ